MVAWPSGQVRVCKTFYGGSIPPTTSNQLSISSDAIEVFSYGKQSLDRGVFLYAPYFVRIAGLRI
jgi:hypothetical protein